jgi:hypothetical protein
MLRQFQIVGVVVYSRESSDVIIITSISAEKSVVKILV